jgi:zinc transport system substrate-binding protein
VKVAQWGTLCILVVLSCSLYACTHQEQEPVQLKKLRVTATIFPLYDMAKNIGKDKAEVSLLLPPGVEAHSYEPKPGDIVKVNQSDVFVYTGNAMEPWAEDIIRGVTKKDLIIVDTSRGTKMIPGVSHNAGALDPHIWLDFDNADIMVKNILQAFQLKDGAHNNFYAQNADDYRRKLADMDSSYKTTLGTCKSKTIVYGGHYAFGYLARRYGLKYVAAQGITPNAEPTAADLVKLVEEIKKGKISYIFYEELTSPKIAETIAGETNTKMLLLNAAHNLSRDQLDQGISFIDILQRDLDTLRTGLGCR